jgi:hypothetical protein
LETIEKEIAELEDKLAKIKGWKQRLEEISVEMLPANNQISNGESA